MIIPRHPSQNSLRRFFIYVLLFTLLSLPLAGYALEPDRDLAITADSITYIESTGKLRAIGNTQVQLGTLNIQGKECLIDRTTHDGFIEGDVTLKLPDAEIKAKMMEFNLETGAATLTDANGIFNSQLTFTAKKIKRTSKDSFEIGDGLITSCPPEQQEWVFKAKLVKVRLEGLAVLEDVSLRFYDVPVFYSPYWFAPAVTKRTTGLLLPGVGYSSTSGAFLKNSFYWAKSEQDDATFYLDLMEKRGAREGIEYRYAFAERTRGQMNADYLQDTRLGEPLWSVKMNHRQEFDNGLDTMANLDMESRTSYSREFDNGTYMRTRRYTDSSVSLSSGGDIYSLSLTGRDQRDVETVARDVFSKRPELKMSAMPHTVLGTPVSVAAQASAASFFSAANSNISVDRLDVRPTLSLPVGVASFFNATPWVQGRGTYYSRYSAESKPLTTAYYAGGLGLEGPRAYRVFETDNDAFKHSITPMLDYGFVPGYEIDGVNRRNALKLDPLDVSDPKSLLTFSLLNRIFSRNSTDEIVRLNIQQGYDFNEAARQGVPEPHPFLPLGVELKSKPVPWVLLNADLGYNHYDQRPDTFNQELGFAPEGLFYLSFDRRYTRMPPTTFSSGLLGYRFSKVVAAEVSAIYDEDLHESVGSLFALKLDSCCWGVSLTAGSRVRSEMLSDGSLRRETETRFYLSINLKGLGDVGEKPSPLLQPKL